MKKWELKHIIKEGVEDSADVGMLYDKESKERKIELDKIKKTMFERLKELL